MDDDLRILIVFGSSYGQTAKIAGWIRNRLEEEGLDVTLVGGDELAADFDPATFDVIAVGASVVRGGHQPYIERFVTRNASTLNATPSAFFSVSGAAGSKKAEERQEARRIMEAFLERTGWRPGVKESLAGAIAYTKYNPLLRWMMKRISKKEGGSIDTSRDHEYTDWAQVDALARALVRLGTGREPTHSWGLDASRPDSASSRPRAPTPPPANTPRDAHRP